MNDLQANLMRRFPGDSWISSEQKFVGEVIQAATNTLACPVVQIPWGVDIQSVAEGICNILWDSGYYDTYLKSWNECPEKNPNNFVRSVIGEEPSGDAYTSPLIFIVTDCIISSDEGQFSLSNWSQYLKKSNNLKERRRVRLILLLEAVQSDSVGRSTVPDPFLQWYWPSADENQIMNYVEQALSKVFAGTNPLLQNYIKFRAMDYCHSCRGDAEKIIEFVRYAESEGLDEAEIFENISWNMIGTALHCSQAPLPEIDISKLGKLINHLIDQDGEVSSKNLNPIEYSFCRQLWQRGLAKLPEGNVDKICISPRGIEVLQNRVKDKGETTVIESQDMIRKSRDFVSDQILTRCLKMERMLKRKLVSQCIQSPKLLLQLGSLLSRPSPPFLSFRRRISDSLPDNLLMDNDLQLVQAASLALFLRLYRELFAYDAPGWRDWEKKIVDIRNRLAHGQNSTWAMYSEFCMLERQLLSSGAI